MSTDTILQNDPAADTAAAPEVREPIIIDMGKKNRRQVRKLRKGKSGRLMNRIMKVVEEGIAATAIPAGSQPLVVIVRAKKKRRKLGKMWGLG